MPKLTDSPTGDPALFNVVNVSFNKGGSSTAWRVKESHYVPSKHENTSQTFGQPDSITECITVSLTKGGLGPGGNIFTYAVGAFTGNHEAGDPFTGTQTFEAKVRTAVGDCIDMQYDAEKRNYYFLVSDVEGLPSPWIEFTIQDGGTEYRVIFDGVKTVTAGTNNYPHLGMDYTAVSIYGGPFDEAACHYFATNGQRIQDCDAPSTQQGTQLPEATAGDNDTIASFLVRNIGTIPIELQEFSFHEGNPERFYLRTKPEAVPPKGGIATMEVGFRNAEAGDCTTTLQIVSNASDERYACMQINGKTVSA